MTKSIPRTGNFKTATKKYAKTKTIVSKERKQKYTLNFKQSHFCYTKKRKMNGTNVSRFWHRKSSWFPCREIVAKNICDFLVVHVSCANLLELLCDMIHDINKNSRTMFFHAYFLHLLSIHTHAHKYAVPNMDFLRFEISDLCSWIVVFERAYLV